MVKIGDYNILKVLKEVSFGVYLDGGNGVEILLPAKYITKSLSPGDEIEVFIYNDSEDRLIATTERPFVKVGEFAFLEVNDVNAAGAFLDWGLPKDLLVPYKEQKSKMVKHGVYLVYVYLDDASKRIVATAKIEKYIGNLIPRYKRNDKVSGLVISHEERGYRLIVDNRYYGMIYDSELFAPIAIGDIITARVNKVREDGKIDLSAGDETGVRIREIAERLISLIEDNNGVSPVNDSSSPELIKKIMSCSKKDFKKSVGFLLKRGDISIREGNIYYNGK